MPNCNSCIDAESQTAFQLNVIAGSGYECEISCNADETYCPSTGECVKCEASYCKNNCDHCWDYPMQETISGAPYGSTQCKAASEESCRNEGKDYCEIDKTCKDRYHEKDGTGNTCLSCGANGTMWWSPGHIGKCTNRAAAITQCNGMNYLRLPEGKAQCVPNCANHHYCADISDTTTCQNLVNPATGTDAICDIAQATAAETHVVTTVNAGVNSTAAGIVVSSSGSGMGYGSGSGILLGYGSGTGSFRQWHWF